MLVDDEVVRRVQCTPLVVRGSERGMLEWNSPCWLTAASFWDMVFEWSDEFIGFGSFV